MRFIFSSLLFMLLMASMASAQTYQKVGVKTLEQAFAISSVMSDSEALTFGIADFELKYIVGNEEENARTLDFKKSIDIVVLPYNWALEDIDKDWSHALNMRAFYIEVQRNTEPLIGFESFKEEQVFGGFVQYAHRFQLSENWYSGLSIGGHVMHYSNKYNYSAGFPPELIAALDGHIFNTSATVLMAEPVVKFGYQKNQAWGQWTIHNSNHYLIGQGVGGSAKNIRDVQPEGWRVTNGVEFKINLPNIVGVSDHIAFDFKRIDIGGDMSPLTDKGFYYETSVGWVIDTKNKIPFLDNVGIGVNINYGSSITGGTIVFYYNE